MLPSGRKSEGPPAVDTTSVEVAGEGDTSQGKTDQPVLTHLMYDPKKSQQILYKTPEERLLFIYSLLSESKADINLVQAIWELIQILEEQGVFKERT